jgi:hypothetical protein
MAPEGTATLVFHFEVTSSGTDLPAIKEAIDAELARADGVEDVRSKVLDADRLIDPVTVGAMIVTVTVAVKGTTSLVDALSDLVESVKRLGTSLGVTAWLESRHKRVTIDATADSRAVATTAAATAESKAATAQSKAPPAGPTAATVIRPA